MSNVLGKVLDIAGGAPIPTAQTWSATSDGLQSAFAGTYPFFPSPNYNSGDVPDCYFDIPNVQTLAATTGVYVVPPGVGYFTVAAVASTAIVLQVQVGTLGTWVTIINLAAAGGGGFFFSDGINVRFANTGTAALTNGLTLYPWR